MLEGAFAPGDDVQWWLEGASHPRRQLPTPPRRGGRFTDRDLDGISTGELESATSSARLFANLIADKRLRVDLAR